MKTKEEKLREILTRSQKNRINALKTYLEIFSYERVNRGIHLQELTVSKASK